VTTEQTNASGWPSSNVRAMRRRALGQRLDVSFESQGVQAALLADQQSEMRATGPGHAMRQPPAPRHDR